MLIPPNPIKMSKLNMFEQVEQMLKVLKMLTFLGAELLSNWLLNEASPPDSTALVTAVGIPSNVRLETSRLGPMMTGPTESQDRRGLKLQRIASIHRQIAYFYRKIAFCPSQSAFSHQSISIIHHREREFSLSPEGARAPREQVLEHK